MIDRNHLTVDKEAESWCVCDCLTDPGATLRRIRGVVGPDDFVDPLHRAIFDQQCCQADAGDATNFARLYRAVVERMEGQLERVEVRVGIARMLNDPVVHIGHADYYTGLVKDASVKRQLQQLADQLDSPDQGDSARDVAKRLHDQFTKLQASLADVETEEQSLTAQQSIRECEKREDTADFGVPFPLKTLNQSLLGIDYGEVCAVGARQGNGKSMFALNTLFSASEAGIASAVFSAEMPSHLIGKRIRSAAVSLPGADWQPFFHDRALIFINDRCRAVEDVLSEMRRLRESHDVRFFAVDYLQLFRGQGDNKTDEIANASIGLKQAAIELSVAVMVLAQYNRAGDGSLYFKGSSQIEQDSDIILALNWPYASDERQPRNRLEVRVEKARRGIPAQRGIACEFLPERQLVRDPSEHLIAEWRKRKKQAKGAA